MAARGIVPTAIVVSESEDAPPLAETVDTLRRFVSPLIAPLPRVPGADPWRRAPIDAAAICPLGKPALSGQGSRR
jgi:hypothetical protein